MMEPLSLSFRVFTTKLLGVHIFRYFTALFLLVACRPWSGCQSNTKEM